MKYLLIILLIIALILAYLKKGDVYEHWQSYVLKPYDYVLTGKDPIYFYRKDRYRQPYRYGFRFYQSYPYPHLRYHL